MKIEQPREQYAVIIIGAGPGGSNLARLLGGHRLSVLLLDGGVGGKVCAGLLSPDAQDLLATYDISLPRELLVSPQLFSVRTIDLGGGPVRHYRRSYMNVDRAKFDRFLLNMVPKDIDVLPARASCVLQEENGYVVTVRAHGVTYETRCTYLVGADGATSLVRRLLFPHARIEQYAAIQQWYQADNSNPYYSCIFDNATSPGCSWIFFKDGQLVFGGAFARHGCRAAFEKQKRKLTAQGIVSAEVLAAPQKTEACLVSRPHLGSGICLGGQGAFLIGEAAGLISPSSFEGISYALASAEGLAAALLRGGSKSKILHTYRKKTAALRAKVKLRCLKRPFMYNRFLRMLILKSGIGSLNLKGEKT